MASVKSTTRSEVERMMKRELKEELKKELKEELKKELMEEVINIKDRKQQDEDEPPAKKGRPTAKGKVTSLNGQLKEEKKKVVGEPKTKRGRGRPPKAKGPVKVELEGEAVSGPLISSEELEVEKILEMRERSGVREFFIKWMGFPESESSWEPESQLSCNELIKEFEEEEKKKEQVDRNLWLEPRK